MSNAFERGGHRGLDVLLAGLLVGADDLGRFRWVQRLDLVGGLDALAADDEVVLASKLAANFGDSGAHAARVFFIAKIEKWLGDKWSGMQACARPDGGFERCHGRIPFEMNNCGIRL